MAAVPDDVLESLEDVVAVLDEACEERDRAIEEVERLRAHGDEEPAAVIASGDEPAVVHRIGRLQQRLADAAAQLRRSQARRLRDDGLTTERIAALFGVTRQRISALLRRTP